MTISTLSLNADWLPVALCTPPAPLLPWLTEPYSLTARLKQHCHRFRLQVVYEHFSVLPDFLLPLLPGTTIALQRDVILWCDDKPCVYAQSWLPQSSIEMLQPLAALGDQPLGEYLFQHPDLSRSAIEAARLSFASAVLPQVNAGAYWGRRSVFRLHNVSLLVAEIFLPDSENLQKI